MKIKDILIAFFGIKVLLILYYLPQNIKRIANVFQDGGIYEISKSLGILFLYGMIVIGVIGTLNYFNNKNIFNPYLKAFFIYNSFSFLSSIPFNIYYVTSEYFRPLEWQFYLFQAHALILFVLAMVVYYKEKVKVNVTSGKKKSTRFYHLLIDNIFLVSVGFHMTNSAVFFENSIITTIVLPYISLIIYYWFSETVFQQTLGKVATGKYVRREDGVRAGGGKILGRTLSRLIPFEPFSFFTYPVLGWHDSISKTNVYSVSQNQEEEDDILKHLVDETDEIAEQF